MFFWQFSLVWIGLFLESFVWELSLSPTDLSSHFNSDCLYSNVNFTARHRIPLGHFYALIKWTEFQNNTELGRTRYLQSNTNQLTKLYSCPAVQLSQSSGVEAKPGDDHTPSMDLRTLEPWNNGAWDLWTLYPFIRVEFFIYFGCNIFQSETMRWPYYPTSGPWNLGV